MGWGGGGGKENAARAPSFWYLPADAWRWLIRLEADEYTIRSIVSSVKMIYPLWSVRGVPTLCKGAPGRGIENRTRRCNCPESLSSEILARKLEGSTLTFVRMALSPVVGR